MRSKATSAESTLGGGRKTLRDTGWKPVRRASSCTSTDTAPYAFVDGRAKKRSATSRCTITHQAATDGQARSRRLGDDRRRDVVREVRDELGRREARAPARSSRSASPNTSRTFGLPASAVRERAGSSERSSSIAWTSATRSARYVGEHAEPGADLEHDVVRVERREASDHVEDVPVDEEVLAERLLRRVTRVTASRPNARVALSSIAAPSVAGSSPRASASTASVCTTFAGSFRRPRTGCGARYGLSVSASRRSRGTSGTHSRRSAAFGNVTLPANET